MSIFAPSMEIAGHKVKLNEKGLKKFAKEHYVDSSMFDSREGIWEYDATLEKFLALFTWDGSLKNEMYAGCSIYLDSDVYKVKRTDKDLKLEVGSKIGITSLNAVIGCGMSGIDIDIRVVADLGNDVYSVGLDMKNLSFFSY